MLITFGTGFYGRIASHEGHWIESKFFHIMFVPIFPVGSMYVTDSEFRKRAGVDIPTQGKSVLATYLRLFSGMFAAFMLYDIFGDYGSVVFYEHSFLFRCVLALLSIVLWVYLCFFFGKASAADKQMRNKVQSVSGMYALPHWLDYSFLRQMLEVYENRYAEKYPGRNWKKDVEIANLDTDQRRNIYAIALFNCMVNNLPENDELYAKADELYQLK
jgi:hypothetical protein